MSTDYKYSISGNITIQQVNIENLHNEISGNSNISSTTLRGVNLYGDDLYISFTDAIEAAEKTTLDIIVQNHDDAIKYTKFNYLPFHLKKFQSESTSWYFLGSLIYPGCDILSPIFEIDVQSYVDPGNTSYDIRIVDRETNLIMAESNFTNTGLQSNFITTINNCPTTLSTLEILGKVNKIGSAKKNMYIYDAVVWLI